MKAITLGRGKIGISWGQSTTGDIAIFFDELPKPLNIGQEVSVKGTKLLEIRFVNIEGLMVLLHQLEKCQTMLELVDKVPLELRFGA